MEYFAELPHHWRVLISTVAPFVGLAVLGLVIQLAVAARRRVAYSLAVRNWYLVDALLIETHYRQNTRVIEHYNSEKDRHEQHRRIEVYYSGKVKFDGRVESLCVPKRWHTMVGKAGNRRHNLDRTCDGIPVQVLVDPDNPSNIVVPGDVESVVGPKGCLHMLGVAMTVIGTMTSVIFFLAVNYPALFRGEPRL